MTKIALVTGASRGIGKAVALRLAEDGFQVAVNYANNQKAAAEVVGQIEALGGKALAVRADVGNAAEAKAMFDAVETELGRIDALINNAGILRLEMIIDAEDETFDEVLRINLKGTFHCLRLGGARLRNGGRIVNFSTSAIAMGIPGYGIYNASKAAVEALSYTFARELRGRNISVNCLAPGPTATDLFLNGKTDAQIEHLANLPPLQRLGTPDDIARVVSFLVGSDGGWVNGQVMRANGGIV